MNELFFDLIRVSLGTQGCMSSTPSEEEWKELYAMAKKQGVLGVCFSGLHALKRNQQMPPEDLYIKWMTMAAKIQRLNERMNKACVEVQAKLKEEGLESCILKGQGLAAIYETYSDNGEKLDLTTLRHCRDIDVWVNAPKHKVLEVAKKFGVEGKASYNSVGVKMFDDIPVELYYRPTYARNPIYNSRLQKWCEEYRGFEEQKGFEMVNGFKVPPQAFNMLYMITHMYHRHFNMSMGMRQLIDYYFMLVHSKIDYNYYDARAHAKAMLKQMGLESFAQGLMWVMVKIFGIREKYRFCEPDEVRGMSLLEDVMDTGANAEKISKSAKMVKAMKLLALYPAEAISESVWMVKAR